MTILVTGGAGYIGAHTCKYLHGKGYSVVTLDNLTTGHADFVKWGPLEQGDVGDVDFVRQVLRRHRPRAVIHFAAASLVPESVRDPGKYWRNNVAGTLGLLQAMVAEDVKSFILSSTAAVYGAPVRQPIPETEPPAPGNPYGATKLAIERMLANFETAHGLKWSSMRYFNAAGADPETEIGEAHDPETHLIPNALKAVAGEAPALKLFGTDYDTPDGTCVRDYIHVMDLADAHLRALEHLDRTGESDIFNLGTGQGASVRQIIDSIQQVTGRTLEVETHDRRPGDPPTLVASADKARERLGWAPRQSNLHSIIESAWRWHQGPGRVG